MVTHWLHRLRARGGARRRMILVIGSNGLVSATSLVLSVAIARRAPISEFGEFSVAMVIYLFAIGLIRASITETTLAVEPTDRTNRRGFRRAALASTCTALGLLVVGLFMQNEYFVVLGLALNGLACLDYLRTVEASLYSPWKSVLQATAWSLLTGAAAVYSFVLQGDPLVVFAVWAVGGAIIGYVSALVGRLSLLPGWPRHPTDTRAAWLFSLDYAAGSGGSALSTAALGVTSSLETVGALRGAGTILGPVGLLSSSARSLIIPTLTRARRLGDRHEFVMARRIALFLGLSLAIPAALLSSLPQEIGSALLGPTWATAAPLLPPLAIESVLAMVGNVASAGHRSRLAGSRSLALRLCIGIPRPFIVIAAAAQFGALGAAWAIAAISFVNVVIWWASYWQLSRQRPSPTTAVGSEAKPQ